MTSDNDLVDERKITTQIVDGVINRFLSGLEGSVRKQWASYKNTLNDSFLTYVNRKANYCENIKSVLYLNDSIKLNDIYVESVFISSKDILQQNQFVDKLFSKSIDESSRESQALIISGPAGIGKSLSMRSIYGQAAKLTNGTIPIFLELRGLNRIKLTNFEKIIESEINCFGDKVSSEQIEIGLRNGLFSLFLDGFDELKKQIEDHYENEIIKFTRKYEKCSIIVSSRPMDRLSAWSDFNHFEIDYLDQPRLLELIRKLPFDSEIKERFSNSINKDLFISHKEFLQIPLLALIMLLTFGDVGKISKETHEFFEDAFNVVWMRHDSRKEGYERHRYTDLNRSEFLRIIAAFSISSYISQHFELRFDQLETHLENAKSITDIDIKTDDFIKDATISTSLLLKDGLYIRHIHKLFHEYFSAVFICHTDDSTANKLLHNIWFRQETDSVVSICLSIDQEKIERTFLNEKIHNTIYNMNELFDKENFYRNYFAFIKRDDDSKIIRQLYNFSPTLSDISMLHELNIDFVSSSEFDFYDDNDREANAYPEYRISIEKDRENFLKLNERINFKNKNKPRDIQSILFSQNTDDEYET